jgi:hypothetical protein
MVGIARKKISSKNAMSDVEPVGYDGNARLTRCLIQVQATNEHVHLSQSVFSNVRERYENRQEP